MNNTYFVGFKQGSSGRFVSSIIWSLINDLHIKSMYSGFNSSHIDTLCCLNWNTDDLPDYIPEIDHPYYPLGQPSCYDYIKFKDDFSCTNPNNSRLFFSHVYPNFDVIFSRFPDAKVIIIGIPEDSYKEIAANYIFKNGIENTCMDFIPDRLLKLYRHLYNKECTSSFTDTEIVDIINLYAKFIHRMPYATDYINHIIPKKYQDKSIVIMYDEIYKKDEKGKYIAYEKLKKFVNCEGNTVIERNYENYVLGRDKFLSTYLPWIKNENYRTRTNATLVS
jgi:hypothetical protein